jgi:DNA-binding response OmpR family regulator
MREELISIRALVDRLIRELSDEPKHIEAPEGLTPIERVIFSKLASPPGQWVSASQLIVVCEANRNWSTPFTVGSLWVHINRLRKKLRDVEIVSANKVGYMIRRKW